MEVREAAQLARRTPETIRRWVWSGRLTATKEGNRLLLRRDDVSALATGDRARDGADDALVSLAEWAARAGRRRGGQPGVTASDLVQDDRAGR